MSTRLLALLTILLSISLSHQEASTQNATADVARPSMLEAVMNFFQTLQQPVSFSHQKESTVKATADVARPSMLESVMNFFQTPQKPISISHREAPTLNATHFLVSSRRLRKGRSTEDDLATAQEEVERTKAEKERLDGEVSTIEAEEQTKKQFYENMKTQLEDLEAKSVNEGNEKRTAEQDKLTADGKVSDAARDRDTAKTTYEDFVRVTYKPLELTKNSTEDTYTGLQNTAATSLRLYNNAKAAAQSLIDNLKTADFKKRQLEGKTQSLKDARKKAEDDVDKHTFLTDQKKEIEKLEQEKTDGPANLITLRKDKGAKKTAIQEMETKIGYFASNPILKKKKIRVRYNETVADELKKQKEEIQRQQGIINAAISNGTANPDTNSLLVAQDYVQFLTELTELGMSGVIQNIDFAVAKSTLEGQLATLKFDLGKIEGDIIKYENIKPTNDGKISDVEKKVKTKYKDITSKDDIDAWLNINQIAALNLAKTSAGTQLTNNGQEIQQEEQKIRAAKDDLLMKAYKSAEITKVADDSKLPQAKINFNAAKKAWEKCYQDDVRPKELAYNSKQRDLEIAEQFQREKIEDLRRITAAEAETEAKINNKKLLIPAAKSEYESMEPKLTAAKSNAYTASKAAESAVLKMKEVETKLEEEKMAKLAEEQRLAKEEEERQERAAAARREEERRTKAQMSIMYVLLGSDIGASLIGVLLVIVFYIQEKKEEAAEEEEERKEREANPPPSPPKDYTEGGKYEFKLDYDGDGLAAKVEVATGKVVKWMFLEEMFDPPERIPQSKGPSVYDLPEQPQNEDSGRSKIEKITFQKTGNKIYLTGPGYDDRSEAKDESASVSEIEIPEEKNQYLNPDGSVNIDKCFPGMNAQEREELIKKMEHDQIKDARDEAAKKKKLEEAAKKKAGKLGAAKAALGKAFVKKNKSTAENKKKCEASNPKSQPQSGSQKSKTSPSSEDKK